MTIMTQKKKLIIKKPTCLKVFRGSHQVEHAAQHGQQQESSLSANTMDGGHHRPTGCRHAKDEGPDRVQVKLREQTQTLG